MLVSGEQRRGLSHTCSVQFSSVAQSCLTLCDPMNRSTLGLPIHHKLLEFTQTRVHRVGDAIQPSHPLSSPSPPALNPSQHQGLFQWVNSLHEVAKILEFQLQHQSFQWTRRTHVHVSILPQIPLPSRLPHTTEQSSICHIVAPFWLKDRTLFNYIYPLVIYELLLLYILVLHL